MSWRHRITRFQSRLARDHAGIAMTEFALVMPFFLGISLWGIELANFQLKVMKVQELAAHVADNASRIGDYSTLQNRKIYESDVDDVFVGADVQAGSRMAIFDNARIILSSLEVNAAGKQYIHWQRCVGIKKAASSYGKEGDVLSNAGIGPKGSEVPALANDAVMFVEVQYDYEPLISDSFVGTPLVSSVASFTVRSSRDLTQIYQGNPPSPKMTCNRYTNAVA